MNLPYSVMSPLTVIRVIRRLPWRGDILVQVGDSVQPMQAVARTPELTNFYVVNVGRELGVPIKPTKSEQNKKITWKAKYLKIKQEDVVKPGTVIATGGGFLGGAVCKSPIDGRVTLLYQGRVVIEQPVEQMLLKALVPGTVVQMLPHEGVVIETTGAFVEGVWGNGMEGYGQLKMVVKSSRHSIRPKHVDGSVQGYIVVGGGQLEEDTLTQAIESQVGGIIVGGVSAKLLPRLAEIDFPVLAMSGIGDVSMSDAVFQLLRSLEGRDAAVCGRVRTHWGAERPYIAVPMPAQRGSVVDPGKPLAIGDRVRALRAPHLGSVGTVADFPDGLVELETGARVAGALIDFDGDTVFVPFANLERLLK